MKKYYGTEGQDRKSYSDTQDRENYYIEPAKRHRKYKKLMVTTYSYPPFCARCRKKATCKVLQSGKMVCYRDVGKGRKLRRVM